MADRSDEARDTRNGDVLGLGNVAPAPGAPHTHETDEARRRRRMREGADSMTGAEGAVDTSDHGPGATGVDMGSGGDGTDIEP